jgi:hypothetical protein
MNKSIQIIGALVLIFVNSAYADTCAAQTSPLNKPHLELLRLQAETAALQFKLRQMEIERMRRELVDETLRNQLSGTLQKFYDQSVEESRGLFDGQTVEEAVRSARLKSTALTAKELYVLRQRYLAFRLKYVLEVHKMAHAAISNLNDITRLKADANSRLRVLEMGILEGDLSIVGNLEAYNKGAAAERQLELLNRLTDEERMELAKCQLLNTFSDSCKSIAREMLRR